MVSESIETLCHKARQAVAQGQYEQARQLYLQALGLKSDAPDVHYGLATVCFLLHDLPSAAYHFKEVTRLDQVDEAIQVLRRGIQLDTHRAEGYYNLGLAYRRKKQLDLAIQAYHEAVRLNSRMPDAHLNLANAYLDKGNYPSAIAHYKQSLEIRPNWEKAEAGLDQAERALAASRQTAGPSYGAPATDKERAPEPVLTAPPALDPERTVDPNIHGGLLNVLHRATIESENQTRSFLQVLENEIEPAIKELSSCLLYPDKSLGELDDCVQKFEAAMHSIRSAQRSLQTSMEQVRTVGEKLLKS